MAGDNYVVSVTREGDQIETRVYTREAPPRLVACILTVSSSEGARALLAAARALSPVTEFDLKRTLGRAT